MATVTAVGYATAALEGAGSLVGGREALLRRLLPNDLTKVIEQHVREHGGKDRLTEGIERWYAIARDALGHCEEGRIGDVERKARSMLKELLVDAFTLAPLDETTVLGSDGAAYLQRTLVQYALSPSIPEAVKRRSPLAPNDPKNLTTSPHEVARYMVAWLKSRDVHFREGTVTTEERINAVRARKEEKERRRVEERAHRVAALLDRDRVVVAEALDPGVRRQAEATERIMRELQEARERQAHAASEQEAKVTELETGVAACREEIPELHERSGRVEARLREIEENTTRIDAKIKETQQAIDEGKGADPWGDVLKVALVIAACAATGWAIQSAIHAAGAGGSVSAYGTVIPGAKGFAATPATPGLGLSVPLPF